MEHQQLSIGRVAELSALSVKLIRHWSDLGIVSPLGRTDAGFRLYDADAVPRIRFARTLRDLGLGLATIRAVVNQERPLSDVAKVHADAIEAQIRTLRGQVAVLRRIASSMTDEDLSAAIQDAQMPAEERNAIVRDFVESAISGIDVPAYRDGLLAALPDLPDDPRAEQVAAWVELAGLVRNPDLRTALRRMADYHAAHGLGEYGEADVAETQRVGRLWVDRVGSAMASGIAADSPQADRIVGEIVSAWLPTQARAGFRVDEDGEKARARLLEQLLAAAEPLVERYWQLICAVNGSPVPPSVAAEGEWLVTALQANPAPGAAVDRVTAMLDADLDVPPGILRDCAEVLAEVGQIVSAVTPAQFDGPTPCNGWNVKTLIDHLVYENLMWTSLANGDPRNDHDADHLGNDHVSAFRGAAAATMEAFGRPGMLTRKYGPALGWRLVQQLLIEMLVHGWDLAKAIGRDTDLAPDIAGRLMPAVQEIYGGLPRTPGGSFGPARAAPDDGTAADRLAAFLGRDPG